MFGMQSHELDVQSHASDEALGSTSSKAKRLKLDPPMAGLALAFLL